MAQIEELQKVVVIGSGPIIIGQAAEFDYAGSQACRALREEGLEVVLVNSNPATIMTDTDMADRVYVEPLSVESITRILEKERPQGLVPTLGGQVGLNLAKELALAGVLERLGIRLLGTSLEAIEKAEDREKFKDCMNRIGEPVPPSSIVDNVDDALEFAEETGYPVIVRPAYTLGGTGGGIAENEEELRSTVVKGLKYSIIRQALIEKSVTGWKEIEFEVVRDAADNCVIICSMENFDPVGIHTGDSIVVAPAQTLTRLEFNLLKEASLKIIRELKVEGGCNIQLALNPSSLEYVVIEVNPRVSRSSALASKATGYPIARVASKIAAGMLLPDITNALTGSSTACFEPVVDYCVVKIPRWPFDKFSLAQRRLGTQMKATGEVMSIERTFEGALLKAVRSLEIESGGLGYPGIENLPESEMKRHLVEADDERLFVLAEALRREWSVEELYRLTGIDYFFLHKVEKLIQLEKEIKREAESHGTVSRELLRRAVRSGYSLHSISGFTGLSLSGLLKLKEEYGLQRVYKMVDTCAGEHLADTSYFYSTYEDEDEADDIPSSKVVVLGSGPIRIGQGIEFDYCCVHSALALHEEGIASVMINNNPETVSTDFDTSTRLYFEPLHPEEVMDIIQKENPAGTVVQFGGQTAINLAETLHQRGFSITGTAVENIDRAEDREKFDSMLEKLGLKRSPGGTGYSAQQALEVAARVGYPVVVRPSYVLGGRAMEIVYHEEELREYMETAVKVSPRHPVLVDKYLRGVELEVDAVSDGEEVLVPGIMEHIERAGVHSGDSIAVLPPQNLSPQMEKEILEATRRIGKEMKIKGIINIQYVVYEEELYLLEVNPRSSRTVPFMSKVTGIPLINLATKTSLGLTLKELGYKGGMPPSVPYVAVKAPVFSFGKISGLDTILGPEMKSTGEVMGIDLDFPRALFKSLMAGGLKLPEGGSILVTVADRDKQEVIPLVKNLKKLGYRIRATEGTAAALSNAGVEVEHAKKIRDGSPHIIDDIRNGKINLVINTLTRGRAPQRDGFRIRRAAAEHDVYCLTSLDTVRALVGALSGLGGGGDFSVLALQDYLNMIPREGSMRLNGEVNQ